MNVRKERDLAWIGDAVLALYARVWLLDQPDQPLFSRQELFVRLTSNEFLTALGEPTRVEAIIGNLYRTDGLNAAFGYIEEHLQPLFKKNLNNAIRGQRGRKR